MDSFSFNCLAKKERRKKMPNNKDMDNNLEMDLYHGRPDYYPYNQEWLDEYFEKYSEENS